MLPGNTRTTELASGVREPVVDPQAGPLSLTRRDAVGLAFLSAGMLRGQVVGPRTEPILVQCAGLEFTFDPKIAFVRHIRWNGVEVLNGIYVAVRDAVWGTVTPQVSNVIVETEADAFKIVFEVTCRQGEIDFVWNGSIIGSPRALTFEMEGEAKSTFHKNRIGFCVLHPLAGCAGKPLKIDREGNVTVEGKFPDLVSPNQPYIDIRGMRHEVYPGLMAEVRFTGDTFEMEDHRNWTDANFKTYCTPLAKPFPVEVKQGTKIVQSVALRLAGTPKPLPAVWRKPVEVRVEPVANGVARKRAPVGFGVAVDESAGLNAMQAARLLRMVAPAHLRVDLTPGSVDAALDRAVAELKLLPGVGIEAAVFVTSANAERELAAVARAAALRQPVLRVARWMVFCVEETSTSAKWVELARKHLKGGAPVGGGTNAYFAELNRGRTAAAAEGAMDFAAYSMNPQVHAFDDASVMENLGGQADTVRTARQFVKGGVAVSPVTLKPRFNPQAKVQQPGAKVDARQSTLFAAAWTVGSLSALLGAGADSLTYYETHGAAGLLAGDRVFPVFHAFASLAGYAELLPYAVSDPAAVAALGLSRRSGAPVTRLVLANLTDTVQRVRLGGGTVGAGWRVRILDVETEAEASKKPEAFLAGFDWEFRGGRREVSLLPYAMAALTQVS